MSQAIKMSSVPQSNSVNDFSTPSTSSLDDDRVFCPISLKDAQIIDENTSSLDDDAVYCPIVSIKDEEIVGNISPWMNALIDEPVVDSDETKAQEPETPEVFLVDANALDTDRDRVVVKVDDQGDNPREICLSGKMLKLADGTTAFIQHSKPGSNEIYTPIEYDNNNVLYVLTSTFLEFMGEGRKMEKMKGFPCGFENCPKIYSSPHHLKVHMRVHTGDRPYKCTAKNCNKAFFTSFRLKTHRRTHNNERPYCCKEPECLKRFKTSGDLVKHNRIHTGERPFMCPVAGCNRSFTTCNICKVHVRTHTGERPYSCTYPGCSKTFASVTNQRNHSRIHSGERPFACSEQGCGRSFTEYSSLYKHNQIHRQGALHECEICSNKYRTVATLKQHIRAVHPQPKLEDTDKKAGRTSFVKFNGEICQMIY